MDQFDLQVAGIGQGQRQRHRTRFAAVERALKDSAQDIPGADAQLEPACDRLIEIGHDITDLADRVRQGHEAVGCTTIRGGPCDFRASSIASGTSSRPITFPMAGRGSSRPSVTASRVPYQSCG